MRNSVGVVFGWWRWKYFAWADAEMAGPVWRMIGVTLTKHVFHNGDYSEDSKLGQSYLDHNELVRKVCPPERLLEFKLGSGWQPLCEFLGAEVPEVPYPNINDKEMFVGFHKSMLDRAMLWAAQKVLVGAVSVAVLAGAAWYWQRLRA
jgi:Sulfotransferase domain